MGHNSWVSKKQKLSLLETFGLRPLDKTLEQTRLALFGQANMESSKFDASSMKIFKPRVAVPTWLGIPRQDRLTPIYNLVNRNCRKMNDPWSVKVTDCVDFRGGQLTYDSHNGTDFAIPVGTTVVAAAPGKVVKVASHFDRGGLKVMIDHGQGLMTSSNHLGRALVKEGEMVDRGQEIALSGASGIELFFLFPWVAPHLHYTVWLNSYPVDPFAIEGSDEQSLWRSGMNMPLPFRPEEAEPDEPFQPTKWSARLTENAIAVCRNAEEKERLRAIPDLETRSIETLISRNFRGQLFEEFPPLYEKGFPRKAVLDLPFSAQDYDGATFED